MTDHLPRAAKRSKLTQVILSKPSKADYDSQFIGRKLEHMRNVMGLEAGFGPHGGAAPKWLIDEHKERSKRR